MQADQGLHIDIEEEMQRAYIDYSMSVIIGRALPDARDGLKPGNRRILYAMRERGWTHGKAFVKCAKVVGEVIGNYHPHGDMAVYDTLVRMAQSFSIRLPLIHGQGNFGSIDGDRPAAYRYTECKLQRAAEDLLADIDKKTVDMQPNFDETLQEPTVLPARLPNLLLNGSTGIAVGMATNIPPHHLGELVDALVQLIDQPDIEVEELCRFVRGPDFPTGGILCGLEPIRSMYTTGRGKLKLRGRAGVERLPQGKEQIVITEIPYAVNKTNLIEKMADLVRAKKFDEISDIRDESDKEGIRIVLELKRGVLPKVMINKLYKHTQLETTFGAILLAIDHGRPREMNLKQLLECFLKHRFEVVTRRTRFELERAEARAHILEGLKLALDHLDEIVRVIRAASDRNAARAELMRRFEFSEIQANAILDMRLYQLTGLERDKVETEYLELIKRISYLKDLLANEHKIYLVIKEDLLALKELYANERRTDIVADEGEIALEDLIANERCVITVSHENYIKRAPAALYRQQRRGGKGILGMGTKETDYVEHVFMASAHDYLLSFTQQGRLYWIKAYDIPVASRTARGKAIVNLLEMSRDEKVADLLRVQSFDDDLYLVMATARGIVKKTRLSAYANVRSGGINAIVLDEGDYLIGVRVTRGDNELMLTTRQGLSIRFSEKELRDQGRVTRGVRGMTLAAGDEIKSLEVVDPKATMLTITENGFGKRTRFEEYRRQKRGGRGVITIRTNERNGPIVAAHEVIDDDALMLITQRGQMIQFSVKDVRVISRNTQGVRLIHLAEDDHLISATRVEPEVDEEGNGHDDAGESNDTGG